MVRITEELVRKKSEHNEGIISTLEELSLHQEHIEKIEHLNNWCKDVQILYLQSNLIPKIENLNKLKKLQYLNLAINNIEKVENLEACESLEKLDLTLNFIGNIESICSLKNNIHLRHLYLTGNPCVDFEGYREYVITHLPQIETLDNLEIKRSERLRALQIIDQITPKVLEAQRKYKAFRTQQKERLQLPKTELSNDEFWKTESENAPETRVEISQRSLKNQNSAKDECSKKQKSVKLYTKDGKPLNVNQAKVNFTFNDEDPKQYVLDIALYKYLDTNLIEVDLQPILVKITIKGKIFQFILPEEIQTHKSTAQRSQTTGHLVITMPKTNYKEPLTVTSNSNKKQTPIKKAVAEPCVQKKREYLEIPDTSASMDFSKIASKARDEYINEIPPLEYC